MRLLDFLELLAAITLPCFVGNLHTLASIRAITDKLTLQVAGLDVFSATALRIAFFHSAFAIFFAVTALSLAVLDGYYVSLGGTLFAYGSCCLTSGTRHTVSFGRGFISRITCICRCLFNSTSRAALITRKHCKGRRNYYNYKHCQ